MAIKQLNKKGKRESIFWSFRRALTHRWLPSLLTCIAIFSFHIAGCASSKDTPARVIEAYYQALTKKDLNSMISLACSEWEERARNEYNSFGAVTTELHDLKCETISQDKSQAIVNCRGKIIANYGNEVLEIDLSKLSFQVVQQGGSWRFCGYP